MSKGRRISPAQLNNMIMQHLMLAELLKISDLLEKKETKQDYDKEVIKRAREATVKLVKFPLTKGNGNKPEVKKVS